MKKLSLLFGLAIVFLSGCKKEDPIASEVKKVCVPVVVSYLDAIYVGSPETPSFDALVVREDGIIGYAVDTCYGFDVNGETKDTLFFTDPTWGGDTTSVGVVNIQLIATNKGGYSTVVSSPLLIFDLPDLEDPSLEDITGEYIRNGVKVTKVVKVKDGWYALFNPLFSTNLAWRDTYCLVKFTISEGFDMIDQEAPGFPGFGFWTYANESYDADTKTICADMFRAIDNSALSRCATHE